MNRFEAIEARLAAFPQGPYGIDKSDRLTEAGVYAAEKLVAICGGRHVGMDEDANAAFFSNAANDLRLLLAVAKAAAKIRVARDTAMLTDSPLRGSKAFWAAIGATMHTLAPLLEVVE